MAVGKTGDLAAGEMKFVAVDRQRVVLANIDGAFYALRDVCGHRNAPLSRGKLIGCLIRVPAAFCPIRHADREIGRRADLGRYPGLRGARRGRYRLRQGLGRGWRAVALDRFGVGRVGAHVDPALPAAL